MINAMPSQRPFDGKTSDQLSEKVIAAKPHYFVTNPPVSNGCMTAMQALMEKDRKKRIGAIGWESFTEHPWFSMIDFEALERKEVPPVFRPSSEKTNFDATYDLEELLLEEAPLEARARRQKPRPELRDDATDKEKREEDLHRMIDTLFEPFDYTHVVYNKLAESQDSVIATPLTTRSYPGADPSKAAVSNPPEWSRPVSASRSDGKKSVEETHSHHQQHHAQHNNRHHKIDLANADPISASTVNSPSGSPPLRADKSPARSNGSSYFPLDDKVDPNAPPVPNLPENTPKPAPVQSYSRPMQSHSKGSVRNASRSGGVQVVLDGSGSWTDLPNRGATVNMPAEGIESASIKSKNGGSGMLGFLSRKKGRERSPKPTEPGVLGKEGARTIIS